MAAAASGAGRPRGPAALAAPAQVFVPDLESLELEDDDARHLARVLRLRPGEAVVAGDGRGRWRPAAFVAEGTPLEATGPPVVEERPAPPVTVGFVPAKGERPEWVVQKLTEVGVDRIVVLRSARAVVRWDGERARRALERLRVVARAAAAQSRRAWIPEVAGVMDLAELARLAESGQPAVPSSLVMAHPGGPPPAPGTTAVAVGPEGGWDPAELAIVPGRVGLGPAILRAETAAMGAAYLLCALRDGLVGPAPE